jgi:hypothetical protein
MAKTRFFMATDGKITVFRASPTRVYLSGALTNIGINFSAKPAAQSGLWPAKEIGAKAYKLLVAEKMARCKRENVRDDAPSNSWVRNAEVGPTDAEIDAYIARVAAQDAAEGVE